MWFIVVHWAYNQHGYATFGDFKGAISDLDFSIHHGMNAEMWMWDHVDRVWYRIDFVNNDKHTPFAKEVG